MKLTLDNNKLNEAPESLLREAGFSYLIDKNTGEGSFVRPLNRGYYPRFHLYLTERNGRIIFNLHLDQKQASYSGAHFHNAEYDGDVVEAEMERIKSYITRNQSTLAEQGRQAQLAGQNIIDGIGEQNILDKIRPKHFSILNKKQEKKSWWRRLIKNS